MKKDLKVWGMLKSTGREGARRRGDLTVVVPVGNIREVEILAHDSCMGRSGNLRGGMLLLALERERKGTQRYKGRGVRDSLLRRVGAGREINENLTASQKAKIRSRFSMKLSRKIYPLWWGGGGGLIEK